MEPRKLIGKILVVVGVGIAGIGVLVMLGVPLGRLPGDIVFRRGSVTIYLPITTSILLSMFATLVLTLLRR